jgi:parvulin-like peptidyl-prolyl isomerase
MMRQMRQNTKWIMLITAAAFVALMVFEWGMDLTGRTGAQAAGGELGRVNGEIITAEEYMAVYRNLYQQQQEAADGPIGAALNRQIEEAAWEQLVTTRLLQQEMRRRGLRVTDEEIRQAALHAPPPELMRAEAFQTDGQFDPVKYQQFLASPALDEGFLRQLEAYYRDMIPRSKLFFQNAAGIYISDAQLWRMYRDANERALVEYAAFNPDVLIPDAELTITDQAIREHYNRNRDMYHRPAQATVRYVVLSRAPAAADTARARSEAQQYAAAIRAGEEFAAVAERAAAAAGMPARTRQFGEEFVVDRSIVAAELAETYFSAPVGQVTDPVLASTGFHLIRVESRDEQTARVRQIVVPIRLAYEVENRLLDQADQLERTAGVAGLEQPAHQLGLQVRTGDLTPALPILPGLGAAEDGVDWAFNEAAVGDVSPVMESADAFYVLELVSRREAGPLSLQEATPTIRAYLMERARIERARQALADAERRARAGEALEQIARTFQGTVERPGPFARGDFVPGLGRMNAVIGAAFGLQPGETSPLMEANGQLFLVRLLMREEADPAAWRAQLEAQRARVVQALSEARWNQFMTALRDNAEIIDNRAQVLRQPTAANIR